MNQLYDIERRAMKMSDQDRGELRAKESRKILERLGEYLEGPVAKSILPASKLGGAFNYLRNHWDALNVFVSDGSLPIDNNQVERLMKRVVGTWWHELVKTKATLRLRGSRFRRQILVSSDLLGELMLLDASGISRCLGGCFRTLANRLLQVI